MIQGASCAQCEADGCQDNLCKGEIVACRDVPAVLTWNGKTYGSCAELVGNESQSVCFQWRDVGAKYCQKTCGVCSDPPGVGFEYCRQTAL